MRLTLLFKFNLFVGCATDIRNTLYVVVFPIFLHFIALVETYIRCNLNGLIL